MTERIKQLAEQAGYHPDVYEMCKPGMEKFAELIIDMCAEHILTSSDRYRKEYFAAKVLELKND